MLFRELSECFTANSLSSQFRFSFWSLFVYDQHAICYLRLEAVLQPRSMEDLDWQAWDHCTSTSYGKWNYCQLNLEYILLRISRKASKQDIADILGLKSALHFDYDYHCSQGHAIKGNRQICSTKYRFRQNLFPAVISINLIAIPLHARMNFQLRAWAVLTATPFMYSFGAPLQSFHLDVIFFSFSSAYRMNSIRRSSFRKDVLVFHRGFGHLSGCVGRTLHWSRRVLTWSQSRAECTISSQSSVPDCLWEMPQMRTCREAEFSPCFSPEKLCPWEFHQCVLLGWENSRQCLPFGVKHRYCGKLTKIPGDKSWLMKHTLWEIKK